MKFIAETIDNSCNIYQNLKYGSITPTYSGSWTSTINHKFSGRNKIIVKLNCDVVRPYCITSLDDKTLINFHKVDLTNYGNRIPEVTIEIIN